MEKRSLSQLLLMDIETVPQWETLDQMPDALQKIFVQKTFQNVLHQPSMVEMEDMYQKRAGIFAEFGKIVCISIAYFFEDVELGLCLKIKSIYDLPEAELLQHFFEIANKFFKKNAASKFAGHNIREFDIPYICRRALVNSVALPKYLQLNDVKPWDVPVLDTMQYWKFGDYKNFTSLHLLATILNIPTSKNDMDGSKVQQVYYQENDLEKIKNYCQQDVVVVAQLILRFNQRTLLPIENIIL